MPLRPFYAVLALFPCIPHAFAEQTAKDVALLANAHVSIASLTDPAKLATLTAERAANPRLLKCLYWLNAARSLESPESIIYKAQQMNHSNGPRAALVRDSLLRNLDIAEKLGCLTPENLEKLRRGKSPTVTLGPYVDEPAEVDHIIPLSVAPELGKEIANLELMPRSVNRKQGAKITQRQKDYTVKFRDAGMITEERYGRIAGPKE
jgi:hypothetical protein